MTVLAMAIKLLVGDGKRSWSGRSQVNRFMLGIRHDVRENATDLQPARVLSRRRILAFNRFVDSGQPTDAVCHGTSELLQHFPQVLEIAADKQLRLPRCDIEWGILCLNRV